MKFPLFSGSVGYLETCVLGGVFGFMFRIRIYLIGEWT